MPDVLRKLLDEVQNPIEIINYAAGALFFGRFLVQWIVSEKRKVSVIPEAFWWISIVASAVALTYGVLKPSPSIVVQQLAANVVYGRNIVLTRRTKQRLGVDGAGPVS